MATLSAKSKIQMSKEVCEKLADKTEEMELIDIACAATSFSVSVGESNDVDITTICDDAPETMAGFAGDSTASITLFYSSKADSAYSEVRKAHESKEKRYFSIELPDGGKEEFIAYISSHDFSLQAKEVISANASMKISGAIKKTDAI